MVRLGLVFSLIPKYFLETQKELQNPLWCGEHSHTSTSPTRDQICSSARFMRACSWQYFLKSSLLSSAGFVRFASASWCDCYNDNFDVASFIWIEALIPNAAFHCLVFWRQISKVFATLCENTTGCFPFSWGDLTELTTDPAVSIAGLGYFQP